MLCEYMPYKACEVILKVLMSVSVIRWMDGYQRKA
jgi:hypothetical protein